MVILFDIDGTLIDHDSAEVAAADRLRSITQHREDSARFLHLWRSAFHRHYERYLAGELSLQQQRRERFREVIDPNLSDDDADRMTTAYLDHYLAECRVYDDVKPALTELTAYPMGIISDGDRTQQEHKLQKAGIDHHFGPLILSAECGFAKPAAGIFKLACDAMGVPPAQALYVGDRRDVDAEGARSAGMHGIWLDRSGLSAEDGPPWRIRSLSDLPAAIARLAPA